MKQKLEKWTDWIETIRIDISDSIMARHLFWQLRELVQSDNTGYGRDILLHYLSSSYLSHVVIGMRRQIKSSDDSISLMRLLIEIQSNPELLTRELFLSKFNADSSSEKFAKYFDPYSVKTFSHVDPEVVSADIERLKQNSHRCEKYADKRIAHRDKTKSVDIPSVREIENCLEEVELICTKYYYLIIVEHAEYLPNYHKPNLKQIFPELMHQEPKT